MKIALRYLVPVVFALLAKTGICQNWISLGAGLNNQAKVLYSDSVSGRLYVGGLFYSPDTGIAAWNGTAWDTMFKGMVDFDVRAITNYGGSIYAAGGFARACGKWVNGFSRWNGTCWDSLSIGGFVIAHMCEYNNLLYCVGLFDSIGGYHSPIIIAWNGNNWLPVGLPNHSNGSPDACCVYQNELYIAGNFSDSIGVLSGCAKWDNANWTDVGGNFGGLIHAAAVYHNELYFGGNFISGPSSYLVKYDGTNFSAVGNGFYGNVWNLRVIDDKLFAVGYIDSAGGLPVSNMAVWDGNNWSAFSNDTFNNAITDVAVFNNELYIAGGFTMINSDTINRIAKYNGWYLGEELPAKSNKDIVKIYPNPVSDILTIEISALLTEKKYLSIYNVLGEEVYKIEIRNTKTEINVSGLQSGVYFVEVRNERSAIRKKIIKL